MTPIEDEHPTRDLPAGTELNILVAEDDPNTRMILTKQLGGKARLRLAADGVEAWRQYQADPPDILLSDWMMPNMGGLELCRRVKASRVFCYVILMTARDALDDRVAGLDQDQERGRRPEQAGHGEKHPGSCGGSDERDHADRDRRGRAQPVEVHCLS